jgi:hypothetical protein
VNIGSKRKSTDTGLVAQYLSIYLHWYWYQGNQKKLKKKKRSLWDRSNLFSTPTFFSGKDDIWFVIGEIEFDILSGMGVVGVL